MHVFRMLYCLKYSALRGCELFINLLMLFWRSTYDSNVKGGITFLFFVSDQGPRAINITGQFRCYLLFYLHFIYFQTDCLKKSFAYLVLYLVFFMLRKCKV